MNASNTKTPKRKSLDWSNCLVVELQDLARLCIRLVG